MLAQFAQKIYFGYGFCKNNCQIENQYSLNTLMYQESLKVKHFELLGPNFRDGSGGGLVGGGHFARGKFKFKLFLNGSWYEPETL